MGHIIHARQTPDGLRYRVWSTVTDSYLSEPLTEAEVRAWDLDERLADARRGHEREISARLLRANTQGTSEMMAVGNTLHDPWEAERCRCGCFHHAFQPDPTVLTLKGHCIDCGEHKFDRAHQPPCKPTDENNDPMDVAVDHTPEEES